LRFLTTELLKSSAEPCGHRRLNLFLKTGNLFSTARLTGIQEIDAEKEIESCH